MRPTSPLGPALLKLTSARHGDILGPPEGRGCLATATSTSMPAALETTSEIGIQGEIKRIATEGRKDGHSIHSLPPSLPPSPSPLRQPDPRSLAPFPQKQSERTVDLKRRCTIHRHCRAGGAEIGRDTGPPPQVPQLVPPSPPQSPYRIHKFGTFRNDSESVRVR